MYRWQATDKGLYTLITFFIINQTLWFDYSLVLSR